MPAPRAPALDCVVSVTVAGAPLVGDAQVVIVGPTVSDVLSITAPVDENTRAR